MLSHGRHLLQWVNELIDPVTIQCDIELVHQTFYLDDVQTVLSIPLAPIWRTSLVGILYTKGIFNVKSAYKVCIENEQESYGPSNGCVVHHMTIGMAFPWHKIWDMHHRKKVKTFAWMVPPNNLPMKRRIEGGGGIELDTKLS
jgi:hypothetical protein